MNQDVTKSNRTYQLVVYVDGVNIMGRSVRAMKKSIDASVVASKENRIEVNVNKTNYMVHISQSDF